MAHPGNKNDRSIFLNSGMKKTGVAVAIAVASFGLGVAAERHKAASSRPIRPSVPLYCEEQTKNMTVVARLRDVVGAEHLLSDGAAFEAHLRGMRIGQGQACAVVSPGSLSEAVRVAEVCATAGIPMYAQGANTGLTGGSVPRNPDGVVINMRRLNRIEALDPEGHRVLCFAGAGIHDLSVLLNSKYHRDSHTTLGSSFLNPSVAAGIALGSGGTLMRKGPTYTERVLYARVTADGKVQVVDTLDLAKDPGSNLSSVELLDSGVPVKLGKSDRQASDAVRYASSLAHHDASVTRFNADTRGIDPVRSEGHVLILASVHDSFPQPSASETLWISTDSYQVCRELRDIMVQTEADLPSALEYLNRDAVHVIQRAGRALCASINYFGIGPTLARLWEAKTKFESLPVPLASSAPEWSMYHFNWMFPNPLPVGVREAAQKYEHHLIVSNEDFGGSKARLRARLEAYLQTHGDQCSVYTCRDSKEVRAVKTFRFAAAPAFQTFCFGSGLRGVSFDFALPKNYDREAALQPAGCGELAVKMMYAHFGCNVFHYDVAISGEDETAAVKLKHGIVREVEALGGRLPAEHGHGTEYQAPPETVARWQAMDPLNLMNPGVGKASNAQKWT